MPTRGRRPLLSAPDRRHNGRSFALGSLLMIPAVVVSFTAAELAGWFAQRALGLDENDALDEAGALGVLAAILLTLLLVAPQAVGIALGFEARRRGARRMGTAGVVLNSLLAAFALLTTAANLLLL